MEIDLLLVQHGPTVALAALIAATLLVPLAISIPPLVRALRELRGLGRRVRGARLGIARARPGDRVIAIGRVEATEPVRAIGGGAAAAATASCAGAQLDERSATWVVHAGARRIEIVGRISVDAAQRPRTFRARELAVDDLSRLADADVHPDLGPITARAIASGEHVAVIGRLEIAGDASGYRHAPSGYAIAPDADGAVHAIGLGRQPLRRALARVATGAVAALVASTIALDLGAPLSLVCIGPGAPSSGSSHALPRSLWLPLAFPPTRQEALARTSDWLVAELAISDDAHLVDLAHALRGLRSECQLEAWLAIRHRDLYDDPEHACSAHEVRAIEARLRAQAPGLEPVVAGLAASIPEPSSAVPTSATSSAPLDPRAERIERARGWHLPDEVPSAGVDRPSRMYEMPSALLRSRAATRLSGACAAGSATWPSSRRRWGTRSARRTRSTRRTRAARRSTTSWSASRSSSRRARSCARAGGCPRRPRGASCGSRERARGRAPTSATRSTRSTTSSSRGRATTWGSPSRSCARPARRT